MSLSKAQVAARQRAKRGTRASGLCARLDKYVTLGEAMKRGTKGRLYWLTKAADAREKLRRVDH